MQVRHGADTKQLNYLVDLLKHLPVLFPSASHQVLGVLLLTILQIYYFQFLLPLP